MKQVEKKIIYLFKKHHITYDQSREIIRNVRNELGLKAKTKNKGAVQVLSIADTKLFIWEAYRHSDKKGVIIQTIYETGLRLSELVNLKIDHVNLEERKIFVKEGKGGKNRVIPITSELVRILSLFIGNQGKGFVFTGRSGRAISTRRVQQIINEVAAKCTWLNRKITPHVFRHSRATHLLEYGFNKDQVQAFLGHENAQTTEIYIKTANIDLMETYSKIFG